nr:uncharacterized peptidase YuxL-like [Nerophis lumbriciformis]
MIQQFTSGYESLIDYRVKWRSVLTFLLVVSLTVPALAADTLTVADYLEFERVADARISPDGRQIVYTRSWVDAQTDRWSPALWIMDADGSRHRHLIDGSNARWSASGDRILFLAEDDHGKPQIFVRWMDSEDRVHSHRTGRRGVGDRHAEAAGGRRVDRAAAHSRSPALSAGSGRFHEAGFSHLFVVPSSSGTARQLTRGDWNVGARFDGLDFGTALSWLPDGKSLIFDGLTEEDGDTAYRRSDLYAIDVESAELRQMTRDSGYWTSPAVAPDGRSVAYLGYATSDVTYEMPRIHVMDIDGGSPRQIRTGEGLYFTAEDQGYMHVFHTDLGGEVRSVSKGQQALQLDSVDAKVEIGVGVSSSGAAVRKLTAVNQDLLVGKALGEQEEIWFEASDGQAAHGWIVKPPEFDPEKTYPLIMEIHGGPFAMYVGRFDFRYQVFAANGFVVLYTNPRGSTGYGEAFSQAIDHAYPSVDYLDLMAGVDAVVDHGFVDEKRMYVGGCSGGGVLSSWVIGHTEKIRRCGGALSGSELAEPGRLASSFVVDARRHVTTPDRGDDGGARSAHAHGPVEEYYAALKMRGVPAKLLRFAGEYHGTGTRPSNFMRTMLYMMSWYNRFTWMARLRPPGCRLGTSRP